MAEPERGWTLVEAVRLALARAWLTRAEELRAGSPPEDLELLLRRRHGLPVAGAPQGRYHQRLFALEGWGRARARSQEALYAGLEREAAALQEAALELDAIGRRRRASHLQRLAEGCRHARADLGLGHWPPAHGALDPSALAHGHGRVDGRLLQRPAALLVQAGQVRWRWDAPHCLAALPPEDLLAAAQAPAT